MNRKFQEYKKCKVILVDDLDVDFRVNTAEIIIEPKLEQPKFNRAKAKREFERRVREEEEEEWER